MTTKIREDHIAHLFGDPYSRVHASRYQAGMPSPKDWMRTARESRVQTIYDYQGLSNDLERLKDMFESIRLNFGTLANTGSHKIVADGDAKMLEQIADAFLNLEDAFEVYHRKFRDQHEFLVVFREDHPKLGRFMAEVQVRAFKEFGVYIESTYELEEEFDADELPDEYSLIGIRG